MILSNGQMYNNYGFVIQARMGSKRFPGKSLKKINKIPILGWIINSLKKVDYLNQDLNYAINEFNLFYELDINLKSDQNKLSAETKNKLLSKFNQLLLQNKD